MDHVISGVAKFQQEVFPEKKAAFKKLATSQNPEVLFITCSDSRIDPNLVTQTEPGDLFICRNAGNVVPPHSNQTGGMTASIEFAVAALGVTPAPVAWARLPAHRTLAWRTFYVTAAK